MRRLSGFSLMEMMIVLAIVAIVAAASAPMINKKMISDANDTSLWTLNGSNIFYNNGGNAQESKTVSIGSKDLPNEIRARLFVKTNSKNEIPHIAFQNGNNSVYNFLVGGTRNNIWLSNQAIPALDTEIGMVAIGSNSAATRGSVAIGNTAHANGANHNIAIGNTSSATGGHGVAIGRNSVASGSSSIAIGSRQAAKAAFADDNAVAIGVGTNAFVDAVAIGNTASAPNDNAVAIGARSTVNDVGGIAIGSPSTAQGSAVAIGPSSRAAANSVSMGLSAVTVAEDSVAIGNGARVGHGQARNSIVIGRGASALSQNSIVIGDNSSIKLSSGNSVVIGTGLEVNMRNQFLLGNSDHHVRIAGKLSIAKDLSVANDLSVAGKINGQVVGSSDRRLKNVGKAFTGGLAELKKLEFFNYTFKDDKDKTPRVGVMAQDLQKVFPNAVSKDDKGFLMIRQEDMFYAVINAVKELDLKLFGHDKKLAELEKQNKLQQEQISKLEKQNALQQEQISKLEKHLVSLDKKIK